MRKSIVAVGSLALLLAACGETEDVELGGGRDLASDQSWQQQLGQPTILPVGADLSIPTEAWLYFNPDWSEGGAGTLYEGGWVGVVASPARFPTCGVRGSVTLFAQTDSGEILEVGLDELAAEWPKGGFVIPAGTESLAVWLKAKNGECEEYDSNFAANYHFPVHRWDPVVVRFNADWTHEAIGELKAGGVLVLEYDPARLPDCRASYRDIPMWDILAHTRFDNAVQKSRSVLDWETEYGVKRVAHPGLAVFPIPADAGAVEIWFENSQNVPYPTFASCPAWDSAYGANYRFEIR